MVDINRSDSMSKERTDECTVRNPSEANVPLSCMPATDCAVHLIRTLLRLRSLSQPNLPRLSGIRDRSLRTTITIRAGSVKPILLEIVNCLVQLCLQPCYEPINIVRACSTSDHIPSGVLGVDGGGLCCSQPLKGCLSGARVVMK